MSKLPRIAPFALALILGATAARAAEVPDLPIEAYRLPNGLGVVLSRDPAVPRVTVAVGYHVGSKNERAGRTGFAHFFEHMMFRGTGNVPDYDLPLQEAGAVTNAFTSEDVTVYFETVPTNYLERALYMEAERLGFLPSALDLEKFDSEREVVKNERRQSYENQPYGLAEETILANVFPEGHPYSWSVIGSMKDLGNASLDDLRRFFATFYHPANATLCLVGDFDPAEAKAWIAKYFGPIPSGDPAPEVEPPPTPATAKRLSQTDRVQLTRVYWAWPTVADNHPDAPALGLLASVLAGGEASRLHRALVLEGQAAREVDASSDCREVGGTFTIDATAAPDHGPAEIERAFAAEIARVRAEPPTADEVKRALALVEKGVFAQLTRPLGRAIVLILGSALEGDPAYYRRDLARYFDVTPADLQRVANAYLGPDKVVLEIRPAGENGPESEAVDAGPRPDAARPAEPAPRAVGAGPDWTALPGPAEPRPFRAPPFVRRRLSNGTEVWISPWKTLPIVGARLLIPAGTADDPPGKAGLATLTATLLDQGTKDKTALDLTEALELLGTSTSVGATPDATVVGFNVVTRNLAPALDLIGPMLARPRFDPEDFGREQQLQLGDLLQGLDSPGYIARRAFRALMFGPDHPYGKPADGDPETVKGLTLEDVKAFHEDHFAADRATLIVVGDVEPDALMATLEATLSAWKTTGPAPKPRPPIAGFTKPGVVYLVDKPGAVQSVVQVGRHWAGRKAPHYFDTLIGNHILGADFTSRLMQNLRVKNGFTYGIRSGFSYARTGSLWVVSSTVRADATGPALREIRSELAALAGDRPLADDEIAVGREAEARSFPESFEDPSGIAARLQEIALLGLQDDDLDTFLDRLAATSAADIRRVMAEVVDPVDRTTLIVGDRESVEPQLRAIEGVEVRRVTPDGRPADR